MPASLRDLWDALPAAAQDAAWLALLVLPALLVGWWLVRGLRPWPLVAALLGRTPGTALVFVLVVAGSVALGTALTAQERALREGTANAARPFPVLVARPGSRVDALLAAVYLQPGALPLLDGATLVRLMADGDAALAAPLAFGDAWMSKGNGDPFPVVGTTAALIAHLGALSEGRAFRAHGEAVAGALVPLAPGDTFRPSHGMTHGSEEAHDVAFTVVGRMAPLGSPWDRALLVPVETVWATHGLGTGHDPARADWRTRIGPPFDADVVPGVPAVVLAADALFRNYALQRRYDGAGPEGGETMAFFPGAELARLHAVAGDVRAAVSLMAGAAQALVAGGVLAGLLALMRLHARSLALLRALGAPRRFVGAVVWGAATTLVGAGAGLGLLLGWALAGTVSAFVSRRTGIAVEAAPGWPEGHAVALFATLAVLVALVPALLVARRTTMADLRF